MSGARAQSPQWEVGSTLPGPVVRMMVDFGVTRIVRPADWAPAALATPHTQALFDPPVIRFRDDHATLANRAVARTTHAELGISSRLLTLDATRVRRPQADAYQATGLRRDRASASSVEAGYAVAVGRDDSIALTATAGVEKHKPAIAIANSRSTGTSTVAGSIRWLRGDGLQLGAGWFDVDALRPLTAIDRNVSLAAGSAIAERGYRVELGAPLVMIAGRRARLSARFTTASIDTEDRHALGATVRRDIRATLSVGIRLR